MVDISGAHFGIGELLFSLVGGVGRYVQRSQLLERKMPFANATINATEKNLTSRLRSCKKIKSCSIDDKKEGGIFLGKSLRNLVGT